MSVVRTADTFRICAVCQRTLLMGENSTRYSNGGEGWHDVCALCVDVANEHGWVKEGTPTTPLFPSSARRRRRLLPSLGRIDLHHRRPDPEHVSEPMLRRLSAEEQAMVEAADLFNDSAYRRTVAGIARSLGDARVSLLPLSGVNLEVVATVAWDISWYQYRVVFDSGQPVRLAERGYELDELDPRFAAWNAHLTEDGRIVPDIPRL